MESLHKILGLDELEKKRLNQNGIYSIDAFLKCNNENLKQIFDTTLDRAFEMKSKVNEVFKLEVKRGLEVLEELCIRGETYRTLIDSIDDLLPSKGILSGEIIEIIGPPSGGKSTLLNTIMINVLESYEDATIMLIDTKHDFSAVRLKKMMEARGIDETSQIQILKRIQVERARTAVILINILQYILNTPLQHVNLKLIMIDSITVPFYFLLGHTVYRLNLMTQVSNLIKSLGQQNISVSSISIPFSHNCIEFFLSDSCHESLQSLRIVRNSLVESAII